jgi:hypothetical protein
VKSRDVFAQLANQQIQELERTYGALVDEHQAARLLGASRRTLQGWRARRCGPPFFKLGDGKTALIRYPTHHLRCYLARNFVAPGASSATRDDHTSDPSQEIR